MTINDRIANLLNTLQITKTAFAEKLKVSQQYISKLTKTGLPSDLLIDDICEKYNVNEEWLRYGTGEMFRVIPKEDETAAIVSNLLEEDNAFYDIIKSIMKTFDQLDPASQDTLISFSEQLLHNLKTKKED
ncbi:MAG: helix-turn-helix transcriptional regulator [Lachnospiraceae bacterium]|nr:helix-turn-helix transcriptional regulator [Lachnospiraceae bacterium]